MKYTVAATLSVAAVMAGTASAKFDDGPAASHYTPRALNALGQRMEAKARYYGKQSLSLQKRKTPVQQSGPSTFPISSTPPECAYAHDDVCAETGLAVPAPATSSGSEPGIDIGSESGYGSQSGSRSSESSCSYTHDEPC